MNKRMKILIAFVLLIGVGVFLTLVKLDQITRPPNGGADAQITIEQGMNLTQIAKLLESEGVVRNALYFRWITQRKGMEKRIMAGEYLIPRSLPPEKVLDVLTSGKVVRRRLTIPEGKTITEIAGLVEKAGITSKENFIRASSATENMKKWLAPGAANLEGVLFPDTYTYTKDDGAEELVKMMTDRFVQVFKPMWNESGANSSLKPYEIVILASIVEKESGLDNERPIIAAVFLNRLKLNMRLMSDPTAVYDIQGFSGKITREHLKRVSPYNTYLINGLPPGPICNPGAKSLKAVFHPATTSALYFVAKGDGSHVFSDTLEEHNRAVERYRRGER